MRESGGHAHQSPDGPGIHTPLPPELPAQGGFPTILSPTPSLLPLPPVPAHSSSQVVHCRVCPPHPLHAPVLVLHLAVYPASPTQGRVGLTDRLPRSAQTQCNVSSCLVAPNEWVVPTVVNWCRAMLRDVALCAVHVRACVRACITSSYSAVCPSANLSVHLSLCDPLQPCTTTHTWCSPFL